MVGNHGIRLVSGRSLLADFGSNFLRPFHLCLTLELGLWCFFTGMTQLYHGTVTIWKKAQYTFLGNSAPPIKEASALVLLTPLRAETWTDSFT